MNCPQDCVDGGGPACGNGVCELGAGENCVTCAADCAGKLSGKASQRFCCGGGPNPVTCADARCTNGDLECTATTLPTFCCGDEVCAALEEDCGGECALDCGAPPAPPACLAFTCGDGVCELGENCTNCSDDCAGRSGGRPASRYCCGDGTIQSPEGDGSVCDGNY